MEDYMFLKELYEEDNDYRTWVIELVPKNENCKTKLELKTILQDPKRDIEIVEHVEPFHTELICFSSLIRFGGYRISLRVNDNQRFYKDPDDLPERDHYS